MKCRSSVAIASLAAASLVVFGTPAAGKGGEIAGSGDHYYLTNGWDARTDRYGRDADRVYVGDWDGDGSDTLAVRRGAAYYFKNRLSGGEADEVITYGRENDVVYMGDWTGNGEDTPVVRRGVTFHFKYDLSGGVADRVVTYGRPGDVVLVGDWDGDGRDTLGVRRGHEYFLKNSLEGGEADEVVKYGRAGDEVIVGDWDADRVDTLGVRRGDTYYVKNEIAGGEADLVVQFGRPSDAAIVGDWDGNGSATLGVRRPARHAPGLTTFDSRMIDLINAERAEAGVPAIRPWPVLREGAVRHSQWMARTGTFEHASRQTIVNDGRRAGCDASAENIAWGSRHYGQDPAGIMEGYMNSPGHRANILDRNNRFVAVGSVQAENGRVYNTQRFARSCS